MKIFSWDTLKRSLFFVCLNNICITHLELISVYSGRYRWKYIFLNDIIYWTFHHFSAISIYMWVSLLNIYFIFLCVCPPVALYNYLPFFFFFFKIILALLGIWFWLRLYLSPDQLEVNQWFYNTDPFNPWCIPDKHSESVCLWVSGRDWDKLVDHIEEIAFTNDSRHCPVCWGPK